MFQDIFPDSQKVLVSRPALRRGIFWVSLVLAVIFASVIFISGKAVLLAQKVYPEKSIGQVLGSFSQLVLAGDRKLAEEANGEINILLLGVGGNGYYGSIVTDTILILSVQPGRVEGEQTKISLLSIPRDFAVQLPDSPEWRKINEAYKRGELAKAGEGWLWLRDKLQELTGITATYYAVADFDGFKQAIDALGGVDVTVDRAFSDFTYPDYSLGYLPEVRFETGPQHLDGERALQFARSRHGNNGEGSDFARIRRQHKILEAFKDKLATINFITGPSQIAGLLQSAAEHVKTNLEPWQAKRLYDLVKDVSDEQVVARSLDPRTGLVCSEIDPESKLYFLRFCPGKTEEDTRDFAAKRFEQ
jgi:LCP family protein required for cell wall assembly